MESHADDIAMEVLTFLPAKSVMRFRSVSPTWNNIIIGNPNFARLHYARAITRPEANRISFQLKALPNIQRLDRSRSEEEEEFYLQLDYFCYDGEMSICSNQCNGLVCLYSYKHTQFYLFNITTREMKAFPLDTLNLNQFQHLSTLKFFLGFDHVTANYKLLRFLPRGGQWVALILTLGLINSSWREINLKRLESDPIIYSDDIIFLNGSLYWTGWPRSITYFNFHDDKFGLIKSPPHYNFVKCCTVQTALWQDLVMFCRSTPYDNSQLVMYNHASKVFVHFARLASVEVAIALLGAEKINDKTKEVAHVLATASLTSAPAPLFYSYPRPTCLRFVSSFAKHLNNIKTPRIRHASVSTFVENIIPLTSLLV